MRIFSRVIFIIISLLIIFIVGWFLWKQLPSPAPHMPLPTPSRTPDYDSTLMLADDYDYKQDDPIWEADTIGETSDSMKSYGCTISAVANAVSNLKQTPITPQKMQNDLSAQNGFTDRGWLIWHKISEAHPEISVRVYNDPSRENIDNCLARSEYPVVKIMLLGRFQHWVLIVGEGQYDDAPNQYLIRDPLAIASENPIELSTRGNEIYSVRCIGNR